RGASVIVFDTYAENGNSSNSRSPNTRAAASASKHPDALITRWRSDSPQNSIMRAARRRTPGHRHRRAGSRPRSPRPSRSRRQSRRPSAPPARARTARRGGGPAGHRPSGGELGRTGGGGGPIVDRRQHRGRSAGVDRPSGARELRFEELG